MIASHFREYWLFGLLFAIVAPAQVAWAEVVRRRPDDRRVLLAGALGNLGIAAVWVASRTTGLPVGPHPGEPEPVGIKDLLATYDEVLVAIIVAVLLTRSAGSWLVPIAWTLAGASIVSAFVPGGHA